MGKVYDGIIGVAIGDALGVPVEFVPREKLAKSPVSSMQGSSGYIVDTLEAAIWCLLNTDSFRASVLRAVNLGDDTDTVGAVTGGLAGIYYGADNIPHEWQKAVLRRDYIERLCTELEQK